MKILCLGKVAHELDLRDVSQMVSSPQIEGTPDLVLAGGDLLLGHAASVRRVVDGWPDSGVHLLVLSDAPLARPSIREILGTQPSWVRPANLPPGAPGEGFRIWKAGDSSLGLISLVSDSERSFDDAFHTVVHLLSTELSGVPSLILAHGADLAQKQALFWRFARESLPVHVLGLGLGVATADSQIFSGRCWASDIGTVGRKNGIEGLDPDIWWKRHRERIPVDLAPPPGSLAADALLLDLDSGGRALAVKRLKIEPEIRK